MDVRLTKRPAKYHAKREKKRRMRKRTNRNPNYSRSPNYSSHCLPRTGRRDLMSNQSLSDEYHGYRHCGRGNKVQSTCEHFGFSVSKKSITCNKSIDTSSMGTYDNFELVSPGLVQKERKSFGDVALLQAVDDAGKSSAQFLEKGPVFANRVWEGKVKPHCRKDECLDLGSTRDTSLKQIKRKNEKFGYKSLAMVERDNFSNVLNSSLERPLIAFPRRKLLILDINGLLADIVMPAPRECKPDVKIMRRAIFKRPFCHDFLEFCFERFDVGIWSSRTKKIIDSVADYLLGDMKHKLLFCWDLSHCTKSGFKTLENKNKELVFKELKKVWEIHDTDLPWKRGDYNESNTLLLDDSPYKALLNPMHTAIFPWSFNYKDRGDISLGPEGDLRLYLQDLMTAEDVRKYVEEHPFGQSAIDETNSSWDYYHRVRSSLLAFSVQRSTGEVELANEAKVVPDVHLTSHTWCPPPSGFVKLNTGASIVGNPGYAGIGGVIRDSNGEVELANEAKVVQDMHLTSCTWSPPPSGFVKLNTGASTMGNPGYAGIGGMIRDSNGLWLLGFAQMIGWTSTIAAELWAIWQGLDLAWHEGFSKVIFESDSQEALDLIHGPADYNHPAYYLILQIQSLLRRNWECFMLHIIREANDSAVRLANDAIQAPMVLQFFQFPPPSVQPLLKIDTIYLGTSSKTTRKRKRKNLGL